MDPTVKRALASYRATKQLRMFGGFEPKQGSLFETWRTGEHPGPKPASSAPAAPPAEKQRKKAKATRKAKNHWEELVTNPAHRQGPIGRLWVASFRKRLGRGAKVELVESESIDPPLGWSYGNRTSLHVKVTSARGIQIQPFERVLDATLLVFKGHGSEPPQASVNVRRGNDVVAKGRGRTAEDAIREAVQEAGYSFGVY